MARLPDEPRTSTKRRAAMIWVQPLERVFYTDCGTYMACGGEVRNIACIEDPVTIR